MKPIDQETAVLAAGLALIGTSGRDFDLVEIGCLFVAIYCVVRLLATCTKEENDDD